MNAPIRTITLPISKAEVVFKEWLTKAESEEVREPIRRNEIEVSEGKTMQRFVASVMTEIEHLTISKAVVSVNGSSKNVLADCLDLPEKDYDFLKKTIDDCLEPPKDQKASS